jgi:predicted small secreted protein
MIARKSKRAMGISMKALLLFALGATALVLSSCNTAIGFGRDLRLLGQGMENSANKAGGGHDGGDHSGAPVY